MKTLHPDTRYTPSQLASKKRTAGPIPDVDGKFKLTLPADKDRPVTTLYGDSVADVVAQAKNLPEPAVNRAGFMNSTVVQK